MIQNFISGLEAKKDKAALVLSDVQTAVDQGTEPLMELPSLVSPTAEETAAADFDHAAFVAKAFEEFKPKAEAVLKARGQDAPGEREPTDEEKAAEGFDEEAFKAKAKAEFPAAAMTMLLHAKVAELNCNRRNWVPNRFFFFPNL